MNIDVLWKSGAEKRTKTWMQRAIENVIFGVCACMFVCVCRNCIGIYDLCGVYRVVQSNGKSIPLIVAFGITIHRNLRLCIRVVCKYDGCHFWADAVILNPSYQKDQHFLHTDLWIIRLWILKRFLNRAPLSYKRASFKVDQTFLISKDMWLNGGNFGALSYQDNIKIWRRISIVCNFRW